MIRWKTISAILVVSLMIVFTIFIRRYPNNDIYSFSITNGQEDIVIDFGQLAEGNVYQIAITVVNKSGIPFQVASIKSTCGCSKAELSTMTLDREPVELLISVDTGGKISKLNEKIFLIEVEPRSRLVNLLLTGDLPDDNSLFAIPPLLQFITNVNEKTYRIRRFTINRRNKDVVTIRSVQSDVEWASIRQLELDDITQKEIDFYTPVFEVLLDVPMYHESPSKKGTITIVTERDEKLTIPLIPNLSEAAGGAEG